MALVCTVGVTIAWYQWIKMPGTSYTGGLPRVDEPTSLALRLQKHVVALADEIGERNVFRPDGLNLAADYVESQFQAAGFSVQRHAFLTPISAEDKNEADSFYLRMGAAQSVVEVGDEIEVFNLVVERPGKTSDFVVIGAHYDSVLNSPGADDNASGVAALLELASRFSDADPERGLRFVAFPNEEPLMWGTEFMGSFQYARQMSDDNETVHAMLSIDGLGYYSDEDGSQNYAWPGSLFYPSRANFVAIVSNPGNRQLVHRVIKVFRDNQTPIASIGAAAPPAIGNTDLSDHSSFWRFGYPAVLITDTTFNRSPDYHRTTDTPEKLNFEALAVAVGALASVIEDLAGMSTSGSE